MHFDTGWLGSITAGVLCLMAGILAWSKSPTALSARLFLASMSAVFFAMTAGPLINIETASASLQSFVAKAFVTAVILGLMLLLEVSLVFPVERHVSFRPPNLLGWVMIAALIASVMLGSTAEVDRAVDGRARLSSLTENMLIAIGLAQIGVTTAFVFLSWSKADKEGRKSASIFLVGIWIFVIAAVFGDIKELWLTAGVATAGLLFALAIASKQMVMMVPVPERLLSSEKAKFGLLHRHVYLVEEPKRDFSFKLFSDILKGRCFDCEDDDSFPCESLDCASCQLPCPCRTCKKYKTRPQGMIVTRQYARDVRARYYLQTTPIIWLSTVAGKDNMDPAKLSLLTDYLVNFMEKSQNGVVLVDGIEYLITSNDFSRVLRAVDRWTETAMVSSSRLIMSIDPRSFDQKELAMLERNREVVRPDADEAWKIIPERI